MKYKCTDCGEDYPCIVEIISQRSDDEPLLNKTRCVNTDVDDSANFKKVK